jgi:Tol biopolymer transport system component
MKKLISVFLALFLTLNFLYSQKETDTFFGLVPPDSVAELIAIGDYFNDEDNRKRSFNLTFSSKGDEMFFSYVVSRSEEEGSLYTIKRFTYENDVWNGPEKASFASDFWTVDINFSPDGQYLFYSSDRTQPNSVGGDIYYSIKTNAGWSDPIYCGEEVNTTGNEVYPSMSSKNNLYFQSTRSGGYGSLDIFRAEWVNGNFINVKNLGPEVNTKYYESDPVISPDESYIIFSSQRKEDGDIRYLYVSFQVGENKWTKALKLGDEVNDGPAGSPTLSFDGKYLFFSKKNGIHWISTDFIEKLAPPN